MDKETVLDIISQFRGALEARGTRVSRLILFGSYASGNPREGSDIDLVVISEDFEARIAAALGHPSRDPHGELIPTPDLQMPHDDTTPLSALRPNQAAVIQRVKAEDLDLLRYLDGLGLLPGTHIEVTNYSPYDNNITIKTGRRSQVLGSNITTKIFVEVS